MKKFTKYSSFSFYNYCTIYTVRGTQKTTKKSYRYVQFSGFHGNNSNPNLPPFSTVSCVNNYQTFLKKLVKINFSSRELDKYVTCVLPKPTRKLIKNRVTSANQALATRQLLCDTFKKEIFQENSV